MGEALEIAKVMVEPATKLIGAVQSAIGKAYEPRHIRRLADAKAYEISAIGQAMREASDIPITYKKGDIELDTTDFDLFVKRTQSRLAYQELTKQYNIESVVNQSYQMLEGAPLVTNEPINQGWLLRFINSVQDISDSELQELWAKILSGEVKQPKSFSLRTLDTLSNVSAIEAKLFEELCHYIIVSGEKCILPRYDSLRDSYRISYDDILKLDECGLINSISTIKLNIPVGTERKVITQSNRIVVVASAENSEQRLSINGYPLTAVGREIYNLFNYEVEDTYILAFAKAIKETSKSIKISAYSIIKVEDDYVSFEENDLLSEDNAK